MLQVHTDYTCKHDSELLAALAGSDSRAFRELYNRYAGILYKAAFKRLPQENMVQDLIQEVFIALFRKQAELQSHPNLKAWLLGCMRNLVLHEVRNAVIHERHHRNIAQSVTQAAENSSTYDFRLLEASFHDALKKLSDRSREIFLLSREQQLSNKAIAERLGISINTVEKHMGISLRIMRQEFREYDIYLMLLALAALR